MKFKVVIFADAAEGSRTNNGALHGRAIDCISVHEAVSFIDTYDETAATGPLVKYEIFIRYDNGNKIDGEFDDKATAIEFLQAYQTGNWRPAIEVHKDDVE